MTDVVEERTRILFEKADERVDERREELIQRIGKKAQIRVPGEVKRRYCSESDSYPIPDRNCKVSVKDGKDTAVYRCKNFGNSQSYGFNEEEEER